MQLCSYAELFMIYVSMRQKGRDSKPDAALSSQGGGPEIGSSRSRTQSSVARNSAQHPLSSAAEPQQRGRRRNSKIMKIPEL